MPAVDVLIPTFRRPAALAVTLTGLCGQRFRDFRVVVSDQSEAATAPFATAEVATAVRVLTAHGRAVDLVTHLPRRGLAEHRQSLLDRAAAPYALFLDDDLILEPWVVGQMYDAVRREGCGFVGSAVHGLSYTADERPHQQAVEFWDGPVRPEVVRPGSPEWHRFPLHSAANLWHVQQRLGLTDPARTRTYKVAWVGGCAMYDVDKLRAAGGFGFWRELPPDHCGEDVLAQQRVMARFGGCGLMPSGAYHLELPTTVPDRTVNAPQVLAAAEGAA